jgi:hypothetical protein
MNEDASSYQRLTTTAVVPTLRKANFEAGKTIRYTSTQHNDGTLETHGRKYDYRSGFNCTQFNAFTVVVIPSIRTGKPTNEDFMEMSKVFEKVLLAAGFEVTRREIGDPSFLWVRKK